jgi:hypothetical protein
MERQTHIIRKTTIEFNTASRKNAHDLQSRFAIIAENKLAIIIDKVCASLIKPDSYISLDTIEINLGSITFQELENQFSEKFETALHEQLSAMIRLPEVVKNNETLNLPRFGKYLQLLKQFLLTGNIPWWNDTALFPVNRIPVWIIDKHGGALVEMLTQISDHKDVLKRLTFQFTEEDLNKIINLILAGQKKETQDYFEDLHSLSESKIYHNADGSNFFFEVAFNTFLRQGKLTFENSIDFIRKFIGYHSAISGKPIPEIVKFIANAPGKSLGKTALLKTDLLAQIERIFASDLKIEAKYFSEPGQPQTGSQKKDIGIKDLAKKALLQPHNERFANEHVANSISEGYVNNAGIILIWPYLNAFFSALNLLEDKQFITETAAIRAVYILQYLASGKTKAPEYLLILNKILCGLEPDVLLPPSINLKASEKSESESLLKAVISNWGAIKNTSPKGLRNSFFMRNGILTRDGDNWQLNIERKSYDMLLDKLPWSYNLIKFPWSKTLLITEW